MWEISHRSSDSSCAVSLLQSQAMIAVAGVLLSTPVMSLSINKFNLVSGTGAGLGFGATSTYLYPT
jgi:hypothetical protein